MASDDSGSDLHDGLGFLASYDCDPGVSGARSADPLASEEGSAAGRRAPAPDGWLTSTKSGLGRNQGPGQRASDISRVAGAAAGRSSADKARDVLGTDATAAAARRQQKIDERFHEIMERQTASPKSTDSLFSEAEKATGGRNELVAAETPAPVDKPLLGEADFFPASKVAMGDRLKRFRPEVNRYAPGASAKRGNSSPRKNTGRQSTPTDGGGEATISPSSPRTKKRARSAGTAKRSAGAAVTPKGGRGAKKGQKKAGSSAGKPARKVIDVDGDDDGDDSFLAVSVQQAIQDVASTTPKSEKRSKLAAAAAAASPLKSRNTYHDRLKRATFDKKAAKEVAEAVAAAEDAASEAAAALASGGGGPAPAASAAGKPAPASVTRGGSGGPSSNAPAARSRKVSKPRAITSKKAGLQFAEALIAKDLPAKEPRATLDSGASLAGAAVSPSSSPAPRAPTTRAPAVKPHFGDNGKDWNLDERLPRILQRLKDMVTGHEPSERLALFMGGGEARHNLKFDEATGYFTEDEVDQVDDWLTEQLPAFLQVNLKLDSANCIHVVADVFVHEALVLLMMDRARCSREQAEYFLRTEDAVDQHTESQWQEMMDEFRVGRDQITPDQRAEYQQAMERVKNQLVN